MVVAAKFPASVADFLLKTLGVIGVSYAVWDIVADTIVRSVPCSDAGALAAITGIPGVVWGVAWVALSIVVVALTIRAAIGGKARSAERIT